MLPTIFPKYVVKFLVLCSFCFLICSTIVGCKTKSVQSYVKAADELVKANKMDEAIILYQKAIKAHPYEAVLYLNQASLFRKQKKYPMALRNYEAVRTLNPDSFWPYLGLGRIYRLQKEYTKARKILEEGLKQENLKDNGSLLVQLGRVYYEMGDGQQALEYFNRALDTNYPKMYLVYLYRGKTFEELLNNGARAKLDYESYLLSDSQNEAQIFDIKMRLERLDPDTYDF